MVKTGKAIGDKEKTALMELFNYCRDCLALSLDELGCINTIEVDIADNVHQLGHKSIGITSVTIKKVSDLVVDYRRLNQQIVKINFPIPIVANSSNIYLFFSMNLAN